MAAKKIRMVPYDSIEFYAIESWLTEQAEKGWQLKAFHGNFAVFERSTPRSTRFCLDTLSAEKYTVEQELRETAASQGWEYLSDFAWHSYSVYRSDEPDAVPFHSDLSVRQAAMHKRMVFMLVGLAALAMIIVHQFVRPDGLIAVLRGSAGADIYLGDGLIRLLCAALLFLFWVVFAFFSIGAFVRARRDLQQGKATEHSSAALQIFLRLFLTACVFVVIVLLIIGRQYRYGQSQFRPLPDQASLRVPLWQTIDAEEYQRAQEGRPNESAFDDFMVLRHSPFAEEIVSVRQAGDYHSKNVSTGVMDSFYDADDCVMRSERYAEKAFAHLAHENDCTQLLSPNGFDDAAWGNDNNAQTLVLRKGCNVVQVYYNGAVDLREYLDLFYETLQQGGGK